MHKNVVENSLCDLFVDKTTIDIENRLDLVEGSNVDGLDDILEGLDLFLQQIDRHFLVFDDTHDLQFLDAVADGNQFGSSPQKTVHNDATYFALHLGHVGLIVPWLDVEQHGRLGDQGGLLGLLLRVGGDTFLTDTRCLSAFFLVVGSEQVNIIIVISWLGGRNGTLGAGSCGKGLATPSSLLLSAERSDVLVPALNVSTGASSWSLAEGDEHRLVGLGRDESIG